ITDVVEDITDVVEEITDVVEDITDVVEDIPDVEEDHRIYDEIIEGGFSSGEVIALIEPAPHRDNRDAGEELFGDNIEDTQDVEEPVEEPVDQTTEEPIEEPILADRIIYFLTPAELRPPEIVEIIEEDGSSTVSLVPQEVTQDELNEIISEPIQRGSRYIQVASYSEESLDQVYCEMAQLKTLFPMILQPDEVDGKTVYRLLVGPATRDEMGVLLKYHLPAQGYNEAMEYKQP
nr:SPOR domain-containing protein [Spirochaetaceae bacterium]